MMTRVKSGGEPTSCVFRCIDPDILPLVIVIDIQRDCYRGASADGATSALLLADFLVFCQRDTVQPPVAFIPFHVRFHIVIIQDRRACVKSLYMYFGPGGFKPSTVPPIGSIGKGSGS
jgi:hypothetical protein